MISIGSPQFFEDDWCSGQFTFYSAAGDLYFVVLNEVGLAEANFSLGIYKLPSGSGTWSKIIDDADRGTTTPMAACQYGDVIHIFVKSPNGGAYGSNVYLFRFNMATDSFLTDQSGPNTGGSRPLQCVPLNDGTIFVTGSGGWYTWAAGSWSSVTAWAFGSDPYPVGIAHDPATDRVFVTLTGSGDLSVVTVDPGSGANAAALVKAGTFRDGKDMGWPAMFGNQVNVPLWDNFTSLLVERGTTDAIPTWTEETIDISGLGINEEPSTFSAFNYPVTYALTVGSTLYVFFGVNIVDGFHNNLYTSSARGWLYETHTTSAVGGWSTPTIIYTGGAPSAVAAAYPVATSSTGYAYVIGVFDPVVFIGVGTKYASLSVLSDFVEGGSATFEPGAAEIILTGGPAYLGSVFVPGGPTAEIILTGGQPFIGNVIIPSGPAEIILTGGQAYLGRVFIPGEEGGPAQIILTGGGPPTVTGGGDGEVADLGWILSY